MTRTTAASLQDHCAKGLQLHKHCPTPARLRLAPIRWQALRHVVTVAAARDLVLNYAGLALFAGVVPQARVLLARRRTALRNTPLISDWCHT